MKGDLNAGGPAKVDGPRHALVLDDDFSQAEALMENLRLFGFSAEAFDNWEDLKTALHQRNRLDLLVVDNYLGAGKTGIQNVADFLQEQLFSPDRIVVLTGSSGLGTDRKTAENWKMRIASKPCTISDLDGLMLELFSIRRLPGLPDIPKTENSSIWSRGGKRKKNAKGIVKWFKENQHLVGWIGLPLAAMGILAPLFFSNGGQAAVPIVKSPLLEAVLAINPVPLSGLAIVADKGKTWEAAGLRVNLLHSLSGKAALESVIGGGADFATVAETPIMRAGLAGHAITVLATIAKSPQDCQVCYRKDHGIATPTDLKGKKVATAIGTSAEYFMDVFLKHHGVRRSDLTVVAMKPAEMVSTLVAGDISAFFIFEPYPLKARQLLFEKAAVFNPDNIYTETFQIVTTQDFARRNPEICRRMLRGLLHAENLMLAEPDSARKMVAGYVKLAIEEVGAIWGNFDYKLSLDTGFVHLLESQAAWARESDPRLPKQFDFSRILSPEPLREVMSNRVRIGRADIAP